MEPLYDHDGQVVAFLGKNGRIIDTSGQGIAWIHRTGSVYDYGGRHLGWWSNDHMRGPDGGVVVWRRGARGAGLVLPIPSIPPIPPIPSIESMRPIPSIAPIRPINRLSWSRYRLAS